MARITISLPENLAAAAAEEAAKQKRSTSAYVSILIESDLRANGNLADAPAPELAEFISKLQAAHAASPRILPKLQAVIVRELRAKPEPGKGRAAA